MKSALPAGGGAVSPDSSGPVIRVCLVEDNHIYRAVLEGWISRSAGLQVDGSFADAETALPVIIQTKPDVVVLDFALPEMKGDACTRLIKKYAPEVRVLILTGIPGDHVVWDSLEAGADGFVDKEQFKPEDLFREIRDTCEGKAPLSDRARKLLLDQIHQHKPDSDSWNSLTERERQIVTLMKEHFSDKEIAEKLRIAFSTVKTHWKHIFEKLHEHDRVGALRKLWST